MAKVQSPCFSLSASGNLKKTIVFSSSKGRCICKGNRLIKNDFFSFDVKKVTSQTRDQLGVREYFRNAITEWNKLTIPQKQVYKDRAKNILNTSVGLFVEEYMDSQYNADFYKKYWLFGIGHGESLFMFENDFEISSMLVLQIGG